MSSRKVKLLLTLTIIFVFVLEGHTISGMTAETKRNLKLKVLEMFKHAYGSYMDNAFPADELMPLSCKGRYRGSEPSRGDVDDSLGNFTLTLIDTLDTLAVLGDIPEFERAVKLVINTTKFDTDVIVSVFETNIRVLGGLLGGHVVAAYLKRKKYAMEWYKGELLSMAKDVGTRLLPAFNTTTGIPYPRINMKHGVDRFISQNYKDTCTACAGTMVLEFAALSRFTGDPVFEEKAHKAMDYLWNQRHRSSDLVGMVINIHNGDWIRRESGVGAGIDSYYEYVLKAYILLGDDTYLTRFNKHYEAIMKYVSQGPLFMDVHMHRPRTNSRNFMDALLAFWPGLQVLKGDIQPAIEMHEMLYQVMQRHNFIPEAFTSDFHIHWGHHPLRPEFVESTYFLYKATGDSHYLEVGQKVIENLDRHARVPCGFAALQCVTKGTHEDQMDSFVLAETFKYLFLLYAEKSDVLFDVDDYIFTTEAHLLPLSLSRCNKSRGPALRLSREMYSHLQAMDEEIRDEDEFGDSVHNTCPNPQIKFKQSINYAQNLRATLKDMQDRTIPHVQSEHQCTKQGSQNRMKASEFVAGNKDQLQQLRDMGIRLMTMNDGRIQLLHTATEALTTQLAEDGLLFMQEMIALSKSQPQENTSEASIVQIVSDPYTGQVLRAGPAQFGYDLKSRPAVRGMLQVAEPYKVCSQVVNTHTMHGRIALLERGDCMFVDKHKADEVCVIRPRYSARHLQKAGAIGGIVIDHTIGSTAESAPLFAMSGDGNDDVYIPMLFLFHTEGQALLDMWGKHPGLEVIMAAKLQVLGKSGPAKPTADQSMQSPQSPDTSGQSGQWAASNQPHIERTFDLHPLQEVDENGQLKFNVGTEKVRMEVKVQTATSAPKSPDASDNEILSIKSLEDGSKQLFFRFDRLYKDTSKKPDLGEIYEQLIKTLLEKTNFIHLEKQSEYMSAIARLLEQAFHGANKEDERSQELFNELTNDLELLSAEELEEKKAEQKVVASQSEWMTLANDQSEKIVQYSKQFPEIPGTEEIKIFQSGGIGVKVNTKMLRSTQENGETTININEQESYASQEDFEGSHNSKTEEIPKSENVDNLNDGGARSVGDGIEIKYVNIKMSDLDEELLDTMNLELAETISMVGKATTERIDAKTQAEDFPKSESENVDNLNDGGASSVRDGNEIKYVNIKMSDLDEELLDTMNSELAETISMVGKATTESLDENGNLDKNIKMIRAKTHMDVTLQNKGIVHTESVEEVDSSKDSDINKNNKNTDSSTQAQGFESDSQTDSISGNKEKDSSRKQGDL